MSETSDVTMFTGRTQKAASDAFAGPAKKGVSAAAKANTINRTE